MGQSAAQPLLDLRDKIQSTAQKISNWGTKSWSPRRSGPAPTAKSLGWADQSEMRKTGVGAKVAPKPAAKPAAKKYTKRGGK